MTRTRSGYVSLPPGAVAGSRMATPPTCWWTDGVSRYRNEASCGPNRSIRRGYTWFGWMGTRSRRIRCIEGSVVVLAVQALVPVALGIQAEHRPLAAGVAVPDDVARGRLFLFRRAVTPERVDIPHVQRPRGQLLAGLSHDPPLSRFSCFPP